MAGTAFRRPHSSWRPLIWAVFLQKLSKHVALLASLLILGQGSGHVEIGQLGIFSLIILSTVAHSVGRAIQLRLSAGAS